MMCLAYFGHSKKPHLNLVGKAFDKLVDSKVLIVIP